MSPLSMLFPSLFLLIPLLSLCNAALAPGNSSFEISLCQDILNNGINATCYDVLKVDDWVKKWNLTTKTCQPNELWANCFMREVGVPPVDGLGCAQVGPSCNEPTVELIAKATPEEIYTAVSIYCKYALKCIAPSKFVKGSLRSYPRL